MKRLWAVLAVIACVSAIALVTGSRRDNAGSSVTPAAVPDGNFPSETPLLQCSSPAITPTDVPVTVTPTPQRGAEPTATVIPEATPTPTPTGTTTVIMI